MFNPIAVIKYQLYLLQLEDYELLRFWRLLFKKRWFSAKQQRKSLVWTVKATLIFVISELLILVAAGLLFLHTFDLPFASVWQQIIGFLILLCIFHYFAVLFLSLANLILWPFDYTAKQILIYKAKSKIRELSNDIKKTNLANHVDEKNTRVQRQGLVIIGIAGSYGKTTMKEVLLKVLEAKFNVAATPESVNTPIGISRWVINRFNSDLDVAIVEMGEHYKGDVTALCKITPPDIAVVTGINEAHLERMRTLDKVTSTIFEIVSSSKPRATVLLNADDKRILDNYKNYIWPDHKLEFFTKDISNDLCKIKSAKFNQELLSWNLNIRELGEVGINLLGEYSIGDVDAAVKIAKILGMDNKEISTGLKNIKPVEHRLQPIKSRGNILVIDDSYNGNPDGVREAIKVLHRFNGHRKIYITPGLVETGKEAKSIHYLIGQQLASSANIVILIKNSATPFIKEGIVSRANSKNSSKTADGSVGDGEEGPEIIWFNTASEAHLALGGILKSGDVILFQNDWGDQYV